MLFRETTHPKDTHQKSARFFAPPTHNPHCGDRRPSPPPSAALSAHVASSCWWWRFALDAARRPRPRLPRLHPPAALQGPRRRQRAHGVDDALVAAAEALGSRAAVLGVGVAPHPHRRRRRHRRRHPRRLALRDLSGRRFRVHLSARGRRMRGETKNMDGA